MRLLTIVGGSWLLVLAVLSSDAGVSIVGFVLLLFGAIAYGIAWLVHVLRIFARRTADSPPLPRRLWIIGPGAIAAAFSLGLVDGPDRALFRARFRLSEPALTREAQRLLRAPAPVRVEPGRIGLFYVQRGDVIEGQVRFITTSCGMIDSCGLVYAPATEPKRWQEDQVSPISGRWWHLFEGF
jgi:hypothetical protein